MGIRRDSKGTRERNKMAVGQRRRMFLRKVNRAVYGSRAFPLWPAWGCTKVDGWLMHTSTGYRSLLVKASLSLLDRDRKGRQERLRAFVASPVSRFLASLPFLSRELLRDFTLSASASRIRIRLFCCACIKS
ncbi:hypothetical protein LIA77_03948 [Sarocladium implicatum]|nr:hypothetical protein LIA77_03948 [Sarocladium implicatum]